jgi:hypothetical protein
MPVDGGQGEALRVPLADGTLVAMPEQRDPAMIPKTLAIYIFERGYTRCVGKN